MDEAETETDTKRVSTKVTLLSLMVGPGEATGISSENNLYVLYTAALVTVVRYFVAGESKKRHIQGMTDVALPPWIPGWSKWDVVRGIEADPNCTDPANLYERRSSV